MNCNQNASKLDVVKGSLFKRKLISSFFPVKTNYPRCKILYPNEKQIIPDVKSCILVKTNYPRCKILKRSKGVLKLKKIIMDVKNSLGILAFIYIMLATCKAEDETDNGYIFTSPRSIKDGSVNQLQLLRTGCLTEGSIKVQLYCNDGQGESETLAQEEEYTLEDKAESLLDFYVKNHLDDSIYNCRIQINGTLCGESISGSDKVYISRPKNHICVIQTDKPLYQPGQEGKFRVLKLDNKLKPSNDPDDLVDVYIEDPKGTRLFQFNKINLANGLAQREFPLSDEPNLGTWRITVSTKNDTESTTFDVKEYVLPKYEVSIKFPPYVLANAEKISVEICAKYTYGKPVVGILNLNVSLEKYSYSRDKSPVVQESVKLDGCFNYTINVSSIEPDSVYRYRRIMVIANVIEEGTGVQRNETQYLQRQYMPLNLNFQSDQRQYFKPGLPYTGKLTVTYPDDSPAGCEPIEICCTISKERVIAGWKATKKIKICKNYTSDDSGNIKYVMSALSTDTTSVMIDAKSLKYARDPNSSGSRQDSLNQPTAGVSLRPFYSPSGSFIQLETLDKSIPCGTQKNVRLLYTSKENADYKIRYEIISQGVVVQTGIQEVSFNIEDDVSIRIRFNEYAVSDEENCQSAIEAKYVPPIGEVHIPIDVDASLSPSFVLLVFYVRDDTETIADSQKIQVEKCFQNEVDFEFGDEVKQPGTKTSIQVKSSPNSLCGLKIVDKSVSLLNSNDQLTKEKIFQLIENMDTGIYYSNNPCNEGTPQPGLYSTKSSSMIRPIPGPWSSSSYEDSLSSFKDAGFLVISNLRVFTRPCTNNGGGYGGGPVYQSESFAAFAPGQAVALASTARRPAAPNAVADAKVGAVPMKSAVETRDTFPETWLFELQDTGPDGVFISKETLPHTITEWIGSAVCVNAEDGLGLSNETSIKGFQAFFISYALPASAIRGEEFTIVVSVFNYAEAALPVAVSLEEPEGFTVTGESLNGEVCIQPNTNENMKIKLKATTVGKVNITVRAETASSSDVCGSSTVSDAIARDAITQSVVVEAEGFPVEKVQSVLFCPTDEEDQTFTDSFSLSLPDDVVPDSSRALVDVTGNVLGPAIENLNSLVTLPTGCGEQNMVKFTPNYLVLDYLTDIGKLTDSIKSNAIRNLNKGYQRELTYRHSDGSFSAFGEVDRQGSMFLTAFVLRSFYEAKRYITIDDNVLNEMQKWIVSRQQEDGCFPNVGEIIDKGIQGGLEKEKNTGAITAYVVASLIISKFENETVINNALKCLDNANLTPYETFLFAYSEALAGKQEAAQKRLDDIKPKANSTDGVEYYRNPNGTKATNLETAAYAVLTNLQVGNPSADVIGLVRYLTKNLNPRGGFYSTQDTCVGLDALSKFAEIVYKDPVDILVALSGSIDKSAVISEDNKLLVQRNLVPDISGDIKFEATGSGCGLIQASLRYNTISAPEKQMFYLESVCQCTAEDCKKRKMIVNTSYLPKGKASGMSVVKIKLVTGTAADKDSLDQLRTDPNNGILRIDVENNEIIIYFADINNDGRSFSFFVIVIVQVENPQPGVATVFDYYAPENSATTSYSCGNPNSAESPTESEAEP
ncbi:murinoglobulin-1 [Caerostris darwini]|uniref:TEP1-F n=1 Tax=Caerostris darwini TaxID=1538125 RepID=A0AAV4QPM6_9ARAC|nr:murinoglobulin-1 [Caerostris darwini]